MSERTSANWVRIRAAYETQGMPVRVLAGQYGVSASTIYRHIKQDGWVALSPPRPQSRSGPGTTPKSRPKTRPANSTPQSPPTAGSVSAALLRRLYRTIDRKLAQLESRLESDEDMTIADHERETRAIGQLIRNVEKIAGLERSPTRAGADPDQAAAPGQAGGEIDAEQIRRELAERILRFREIERAEPR